MTTSHPAPDEARIEALEAACAHQDRVIAELSDAVAAQWARIDALTREVLRLRDEVQAQGERGAPRVPREIEKGAHCPSSARFTSDTIASTTSSTPSVELSTTTASFAWTSGAIGRVLSRRSRSIRRSRTGATADTCV